MQNSKHFCLIFNKLRLQQWNFQTFIEKLNRYYRYGIDNLILILNHVNHDQFGASKMGRNLGRNPGRNPGRDPVCQRRVPRRPVSGPLPLSPSPHCPPQRRIVGFWQQHNGPAARCDNGTIWQCTLWNGI